MKIWTTINGDEISYKKLETNHLRNILNFIEKKAKDGHLLQYGGGGWEAEDMWYDEEIIYGDEVYDYFDYYSLKKELESRNN